MDATNSVTRTAGVDPSRAAEIIVDSGSSDGRRGSGYRISNSLVLTAAHVIADSRRILIRFNADRDDEWTSDGTVVWYARIADLALISIEPREDKAIETARLGRIGDCDAVLTCTALGFPRFKLRAYPGKRTDQSPPMQYRDCCHLVASAPLLSNRREATLELLVAVPPAPDHDPARSPWEGMSGAAVFTAGRIVGVVSEHHRSDGLGRLAATRMDTAFERLSKEEFRRVRELLRLPEPVSELPEVAVFSIPAPVEAMHRAIARSIAPIRLEDRTEELGSLVEFCAGTESYQWIQAPPWAGKTALMSWFALHPPNGVRVASFFVTSRLSGQADSDAFVDAVTRQLAVLADESFNLDSRKSSLHWQYTYLLESATARLRERGERLILLVDGLDEDQGRNPSIASLLPRRPQENVYVLVSSRLHPELPDDVPGDHPLRSCKRRWLSPSRYAHHKEIEAKRELNELLHHEENQREIIALITASSSGLTVSDLSELIGRPRLDILHQLHGFFGRSLQIRATVTGQDVYLLAHETLQAAADRVLGNDIVPYRAKIHAWVERYRDAHWPETTPSYLFVGYSRLLSRLRDQERLVAFACDSERHYQMARHTRSDFAALTEIGAAQELIAAGHDLTSLTLIAVEHERITNRNAAIPIDLILAWVRLGQTIHALELVQSIPSSSGRILAQAWFAAALANSDPREAARLAEQAAAIAHSLGNREYQKQALSQIAIAFARAGQWDRAQQTASALGDMGDRMAALAAVAEAAADHDLDRAIDFADQAEQLANAVISPPERIVAMAEVAALIAGFRADRATRLADQAEQLARTVPNFETRTRALAQVAVAFARSGQWDQATAIAHSLGNREYQKQALSQIAIAFARAGQWDRAQQTASALGDMGDRMAALAAVAEAAADHDLDRAIDFADQAEQLANAVISPPERIVAMAEVAALIAGFRADRATRLADQAEQLARTVPNFETRTRALAQVAVAFARSGQWDQAAAIAHSLGNREYQKQALSQIAIAFARAGQWDRAQQTASALGDMGDRMAALAAVAEAAADHDLDRAIDFADQAEQLASIVPDYETRTAALAKVALAFARAGQWDRVGATAHSWGGARLHAWEMADLAAMMANHNPDHAVQLTEEAASLLSSTPDPAAVMCEIGVALARAGRLDRAEGIARSLRSPKKRARVVAELAIATARTRRWDRAEQMAHTLSDPEQRARVWAEISVVMAEAGLWSQAESAARTITESLVRAQALIRVAEKMAAYIAQGDSGGVTMPQLRGLVASVLVSEHWSLAIPFLGDLEADKLNSVFAALSVEANGFGRVSA